MPGNARQSQADQPSLREAVKKLGEVNGPTEFGGALPRQTPAHSSPRQPAGSSMNATARKHGSAGTTGEA